MLSMKRSKSLNERFKHIATSAAPGVRKIKVCIWRVVVLRSGANDVGIVDRSRDRDGTSAAGVYMAQEIADSLEFVRDEFIIIVEHRIMRRARSTQETSMALKVEVKLEGMRDHPVNDSPGETVSALVDFSFSHVCVFGEEPIMMTLAYDDKGDLGFDRKLGAYFLQNRHFLLHNLQKLALGNTIPEE